MVDASPRSVARVVPFLVRAGLIAVAVVTTVVAPPPWPAVAGTGMLATSWLGRRRLPEVVIAALLAWGCVAMALAVPIGWVWPVPPAVGLVAFAVLTVVTGTSAHRTWLRRGRADRASLVLGWASVPVTAVALVAFITSGRTDVRAATESLQALSLPWLVLAGIGFVLVNPAVEEVLFRGLLQPALESLGASVPIAIVGQAAAFGAIHLVGVPGGLLGMVMAGTWGAVLGALRHRTGGLLLVWIVHVAANVAIFTTVVVVARREGILLAARALAG